jgi:hypothetical protein
MSHLGFLVKGFSHTSITMRAVWQRLDMPAQFFIRAMRFKNIKGDQITNDSDIPYESILAYIEESIANFNDKKRNEVREHMHEKYPGDTGTIQRDRYYFNYLKTIGKTIEHVKSTFREFESQGQMEIYCKASMNIDCQPQTQTQSQPQSLSNPPSNQLAVLRVRNETSSSQTAKSPNSSQPSYIPTPQAQVSLHPPSDPMQQSDAEIESAFSTPLIATSSRHARTTQKRSQLQSIHDDIKAMKDQQILHSELLIKICHKLDIDTATDSDTADSSGFYNCVISL